MANRVLLDANGLKISKPGFNVLATGDDNLLFDSSSKMAQVVASGSRTISGGGTADVTFPNLGFVPYVWFWSGDKRAVMRYVSNTRIRFHGQTAGSGTIHYLVLNVPMT